MESSLATAPEMDSLSPDGEELPDVLEGMLAVEPGEVSDGELAGVEEPLGDGLDEGSPEAMLEEGTTLDAETSVDEDDEPCDKLDELVELESAASRAWIRCWFKDGNSWYATCSFVTEKICINGLPSPAEVQFPKS